MSEPILKPGLTRQPIRDHEVYVVLSGTGGSALNSVLLARAPLAGIDIGEQVSAQVSTALNNDVLVSTFGHAPVQINVYGLEFYGACNPKADDDVSTFYGNYNAYYNPDARVDFSIGSTTYTGVLLSLAQSATADAGSAGSQVSRWNMSLVGVRR